MDRRRFIEISGLTSVCLLMAGQAGLDLAFAGPKSTSSDRYFSGIHSGRRGGRCHDYRLAVDDPAWLLEEAGQRQGCGA